MNEGECTMLETVRWGFNLFFFVIKIDQSETTSSYLFITSIKVINHKMSCFMIASKGKRSLIAK